MGNLKKLLNDESELRHNVSRRIGQLLLVDILTALLLFMGAGTINWPYAWIYVILCFMVTLLAPFVAPLEILAERGSKKANPEKWDKILVRLLALSGFSIYLVAGLDFRWRWTPEMSSGLHIGAILFFLLGFALTVWAMYVNHFFSTTVRIQFDRGHKVCTTGPYRYIRHPGYLGMIVYYSASPIFLGSIWAMLPALITATLFVIRTKLEDDTLLKKLSGYEEYALRTKYRLIPWVW